MLAWGRGVCEPQVPHLEGLAPSLLGSWASFSAMFSAVGLLVPLWALTFLFLKF